MYLFRARSGVSCYEACNRSSSGNWEPVKLRLCCFFRFHQVFMKLTLTTMHLPNLSSLSQDSTSQLQMYSVYSQKTPRVWPTEMKHAHPGGAIAWHNSCNPRIIVDHWIWTKCLGPRLSIDSQCTVTRGGHLTARIHATPISLQCLPLL